MAMSKTDRIFPVLPCHLTLTALRQLNLPRICAAFTITRNSFKKIQGMTFLVILAMARTFNCPICNWYDFFLRALFSKCFLFQLWLLRTATSTQPSTGYWMHDSRVSKAKFESARSFTNIDEDWLTFPLGSHTICNDARRTIFVCKWRIQFVLNFCNTCFLSWIDHF